MFRKLFKILIFFIISLIGILILFFGFISIAIRVYKPKLPTNQSSIYSAMSPVETKKGLFILGNNWIRKNRHDLWEMYIEGDAFNRGVAAGKLSEKLIKEQEEIFISEINKVVPSKIYQEILLDGIAWFDRNLPDKINHEQLLEIYGISLSASHKYDSYGPPYVRLLNYHAAHDIGHALQSYNLVGCTSFATWNKYSKDSALIIGRNFDFYFGDEFAENKIIEFVVPDSGNKFAFVTWGGMIGVVSGMNEKGLTVTINAGTLGIGRHSATPVTLIAREILQYASNIEQAIKIASKSRLFVSESFLIGSAADKKAVIIEKRPDDQDIVYPDSSALLCTNHYQGNTFVSTPSNIKNKENNATGYRFLRLQQLINQTKPIDPAKTVAILRNVKGLNDSSIGLGNEKSLNQLLAHHSVIFEPEKLIMWVSTTPNTLGPYMAYDLKKIFAHQKSPINGDIMDEQELEIPADSSFLSDEYQKYLNYKSFSVQIKNDIKNKTLVADSILNFYLKLNPDYFETYVIAGDYYQGLGNYRKAKDYYLEGLNKEANNLSTRNKILQQFKNCNKHLQP